MIARALDTETHLIKPGLLAPRMVCLSHAERTPSGRVATGLVLRPAGVEWLRGNLADLDAVVVSHNLPYDLGVACAEDPALLPLVFDAYAGGRAQCTITRQKLFDVAHGMRKFRRVKGKVTRSSYSLADLV